MSATNCQIKKNSVIGKALERNITRDQLERFAFILGGRKFDELGENGLTNLERALEVGDDAEDMLAKLSIMQQNEKIMQAPQSQRGMLSVVTPLEQVFKKGTPKKIVAKIRQAYDEILASRIKVDKELSDIKKDLETYVKTHGASAKAKVSTTASRFTGAFNKEMNEAWDKIARHLNDPEAYPLDPELKPIAAKARQTLDRVYWDQVDSFIEGIRKKFGPDEAAKASRILKDTSSTDSYKSPEFPDPANPRTMTRAEMRPYRHNYYPKTWRHLKINADPDAWDNFLRRFIGEEVNGVKIKTVGEARDVFNGVDAQEIGSSPGFNGSFQFVQESGLPDWSTQFDDFRASLLSMAKTPKQIDAFGVLGEEASRLLSKADSEGWANLDQLSRTIFEPKPIEAISSAQAAIQALKMVTQMALVPFAAIFSIAQPVATAIRSGAGLKAFTRIKDTIKNYEQLSKDLEDLGLKNPQRGSSFLGQDQLPGGAKMWQLVPPQVRREIKRLGGQAASDKFAEILNKDFTKIRDVFFNVTLQSGADDFSKAFALSVFRPRLQERMANLLKKAPKKSRKQLEKDPDFVWLRQNVSNFSETLDSPFDLIARGGELTTQEMRNAERGFVSAMNPSGNFAGKSFASQGDFAQLFFVFQQPASMMWKFTGETLEYSKKTGDYLPLVNLAAAGMATGHAIEEIKQQMSDGIDAGIFGAEMTEDDKSMFKTTFDAYKNFFGMPWVLYKSLELMGVGGYRHGDVSRLVGPMEYTVSNFADISQIVFGDYKSFIEGSAGLAPGSVEFKKHIADYLEEKTEQ